MIVLGLIAAVVGALLHNELVVKLGVVLVAVGIILAVLGHPVY